MATDHPQIGVGFQEKSCKKETMLSCTAQTQEKQQLYQIVSVSQWTAKSDQHQQPIPLVDLRPSSDYHKKHIINGNVAVVNLPLKFLLNGQRSCELPPRNTSFAILVPCMYYTRTEFNNVVLLDPELLDFFYATQSKVTKQSRVKWKVEQVLLDDDSLWEEAKQLNILCEDNKNSTTSLQIQPRLWEPNPFVQHDLLPLLLEELAKSTEKTIEVWDLGSGSGRDICFLAESILPILPVHEVPHIKFVGIDNHKGSAARCRPLWDRRLPQHNAVTFTKQLDLNKIPLFHEFLSSSSSEVKMFYCVRYMNRKLFHYIANNSTSSFPIGSIFAVTHFCKETMGAPWKFDHPGVSS